jgi:hypothetical protein
MFFPKLLILLSVCDNATPPLQQALLDCRWVQCLFITHMKINADIKLQKIWLYVVCQTHYTDAQIELVRS